VYAPPHPASARVILAYGVRFPSFSTLHGASSGASENGHFLI